MPTRSWKVDHGPSSPSLCNKIDKHRDICGIVQYSPVLARRYDNRRRCNNLCGGKAQTPGEKAKKESKEPAHIQYYSIEMHHCMVEPFKVASHDREEKPRRRRNLLSAACQGTMWQPERTGRTGAELLRRGNLLMKRQVSTEFGIASGSFCRAGFANGVGTCSGSSETDEAHVSAGQIWGALCRWLIESAKAST